MEITPPKANEICYNYRCGSVSSENNGEFLADELPFAAVKVSAKENGELLDDTPCRRKNECGG